jgi:4-amino-4-deoxy-L-arabinose transferase-like glycosyltransferase
LAKKRKKKTTQVILLLLILAAVLLVRVRLADVPLERDEGEYAYFGQLILEGIPPYSLAYNMKLPGTYFMYAGIMAVFGQSVRGLHLGLLLINGLTIFIIFQLTRKIADDSTALMSAAVYAVLSLSSSVLGFAGHATHFVSFFAVWGFYILIRAFEKYIMSVFLISGILFGMAFLMKQAGFLFFLFGITVFIYDFFRRSPRHYKKSIINLLFYSLGAFLPFLITSLVLYFSGVLEKFWFWTFTYAAKYGTQVPLSEALGIFRSRLFSVMDGFFLVWIFFVLGITVSFFHKRIKNNRIILLLFALFSFLSICPGFYFRPHYFITLLPAVAIFAALFIDHLNAGLMQNGRLTPFKFLSVVLLAIAVLMGVIKQKGYLFEKDPKILSREIYGLNPFPESLKISEFIKSRTQKNDRIVVFGSEPQIYFYSARRSATGYIYTYNLMEKHAQSLNMQKEMAAEIIASDPKFFVFVNVSTSWLRRKDSERYIFGWANSYLKNRFELVGVVDIISPVQTIYKWDSEVKNYKIRSQNSILLFEKKNFD